MLGFALAAACAALGAWACGDAAGPTDERATALVLGDRHGCRLVGATAQCWGRGTSGELGDGARANTTAPVLLSPS